MTGLRYARRRPELLGTYLGRVALAAALPAFLRYDGRQGLARKQSEDAAWAASAADRQSMQPAPVSAVAETPTALPSDNSV